jgi:hypothetical protein
VGVGRGIGCRAYPSKGHHSHGHVFFPLEEPAQGGRSFEEAMAHAQSVVIVECKAPCKGSRDEGQGCHHGTVAVTATAVQENRGMGQGRHREPGAMAMATGEELEGMAKVHDGRRQAQVSRGRGSLRELPD